MNGKIEKLTVTSAEAAKMLRKLSDEHTAILAHEENSREFLASVGEDPETVRPDYDYEATQAKLAEIEDAVRALKHALNVFNTTTVVPEFGMTVDRMLVFIPQLSARKAKLFEMKSRLKKMRAEPKYGRQQNFIDYSYVNYDIARAEADYAAAADELARAQLALDRVNSTETFEVTL